MKMKQISVPIENSKTLVYEVVRSLEEKNIDIRGISIADTGDCGMLRIISPDVGNVRRILMQHHIPARVEDVVAVELAGEAGGMTEVMRDLMGADIQIKYAYRCNEQGHANPIMVLACSDTEKAMQVIHNMKIQRRVA